MNYRYLSLFVFWSFLTVSATISLSVSPTEAEESGSANPIAADAASDDTGADADSGEEVEDGDYGELDEDFEADDLGEGDEGGEEEASGGE